MRVRFLKTVQFECEGRNKGPIYSAGEVYDFDDAFARRWLRRAVAVEEADLPVSVAETAPSSEFVAALSELRDEFEANAEAIKEMGDRIAALPSDYSSFTQEAVVLEVEQPKRKPGRPRKA